MAGGDESLMKALEQGISRCGAVVVCDLVVRVAELQALTPIYDQYIQKAIIFGGKGGRGICSKRRIKNGMAAKIGHAAMATQES